MSDLDLKDQGMEDQEQGGSEGQMEEEEPVYQDIGRIKKQREEEMPEEEEAV